MEERWKVGSVAVSSGGRGVSDVIVDVDSTGVGSAPDEVFGSDEQRVERMPSVVWRVRVYGDVKKWRVSEGRSSLRRWWPAW